jgi:hypothetical protein
VTPHLNDRRMAGYRALAAVGRSITAVLNQGYAAAIPVGRRPTAVLAGTSDFENVNNPNPVISPPSVAVYCYRLTVDRETRPGWSAVASSDGRPRIPLQMHLLVSAWDTLVESELEWLGLTAQILETTSILTGPLLDPTGEWERGDAVQVTPDDLALDSMSEAFQALTTDYRCCLPYVARVIVIDGNPTAVGPQVATVGAVLEGTLA